MSDKSGLSILKVRLDPSTSTSRPPSRSSYLKDKVFAKVVQPLRSRSKSSLGSSIRGSREFSTGSNSRPSFETSRSSNDSDILSSRTPSSNYDEKPLPCVRFVPETVQVKPRLSIIPELDTLDHERSGEFWTMVEIFGDVDLGKVPLVPLDVVAVLDCSAYSSNDSLQGACEAVNHIARSLSRDDRLAIIATSQRHVDENASVPTGCIVRQLSSPDPRAIEVDLLHAIDRRVMTNLHDADLSESLVAAFRLLGYPTNTSPTHFSYKNHRQVSIVSRNASQLVIVASPNYSEFCDILRVAPVPVHIIQVGIVPWHPTQPECDGWKVSGSILQNDTKFLEHELSKLLSHARTGATLESVIDLDIDIKAAAGCTIKRIIGKYAHDFLHAGETVSVGVLVAVPQFQSFSSEANPTSSQSGINEHLISELESMLGVASQKILSVQVSFKSSSSRGKQVIDVKEETVSIGRFDPSSYWLGRTKLEIARAQETHMIVAYKRLMLLAAQNYPLHETCDVIDSIIPKQQRHPEIEGAKMLLAKEIQFKTMVTGRCQPFSSQAPSEGVIGLDTKDDARSRSTSELRSSPSCGSQNSNATTVHHELDQETQSDTEDGSPDEARKIWKVMRSQSRSKKQQKFEASWALEGMGPPSENIELLRRAALQSKRSIGADTLRSLSLDVGLLRREHQAPWL